MVGMRNDASVESLAQELEDKAADLWGQERASRMGPAMRQAAEHLQQVANNLPKREEEPAFFLGQVVERLALHPRALARDEAPPSIRMATCIIWRIWSHRWQGNHPVDSRAGGNLRLGVSGGSTLALNEQFSRPQ